MQGSSPPPLQPPGPVESTGLQQPAEPLPIPQPIPQPKPQPKPQPACPLPQLAAPSASTTEALHHLTRLRMATAVLRLAIPGPAWLRQHAWDKLLSHSEPAKAPLSPLGAAERPCALPGAHARRVRQDECAAQCPPASCSEARCPRAQAGATVRGPRAQARERERLSIEHKQGL
eukprot:scaffold123092_cov69-Phaeocystis_antarctica.AAC.2